MRNRVIDQITIISFAILKHLAFKEGILLTVMLAEGTYILYLILYPRSTLSSLPPLITASVPLSSFPVLPFPSLYRSGYFLPLPLILCIPFLFAREKNLSGSIAFLYPLLFLIPVKLSFLPFIIFLSIASVRSMEEEVIYGERFIGTFARALSLILYTTLLFLVFIPSIKKDLTYIFTTLLIVTAGFLLKSATILLRHKLYFVHYSFVIACFLLPAFR